MKKKLIFSLVLVAAIIGSIASTALATTIEVGGGTWTYGTYDVFPTSNHVGYSYYYHPTNVHTSSVMVDQTLYRSSNTAPGQTSIAESAWTTSWNISFYYNPQV